MGIQAEFQALIDRYLAGYESHDARACASQYAQDGKVFSPWSAPVSGTEAIEALHEEWFLDGESDKVMTVFDARANGDIGYCLVRYAANVPGNPGGLERIFGSSLNTLTRQPDGHWKIQHTSINELDNEEAGFER